MNHIAYLSVGVASGYRARARMKRNGCTPKGHPLWSESDIAKLRALYPDYQAAMRSLGRSYCAVKAKAQQLGLAPTRDHWTGEQLVRLRKLYRSGTREELQEAFPTRKLSNVYGMARYFGLRRPRKPYERTGHLVIDQIRDRCFELCLSMSDLDEMAKTGSYFAKAGWIGGTVNAKAIAKAVAALDGKLVAVWNEEGEPSIGSAPLLTAPRLRLAA